MKHPRRGHTLVECLAGFAILSAILGTITLSMYSLHKADREARQAVDHYQRLQRLTDALRRDVHQARKAELIAEENGAGKLRSLQLELDARTVRYTEEEDRILRTVERDGEVVHRDGYRLATGMKATWQIDQKRHHPMVSLRLEPPSEADPTRRHVAAWSVNAVLALLPSELPLPATPSEEETSDE
jgi:type II secretory pathway component PulJ